MSLRLLVIEDRQSDFDLLGEQLRRQGLDASCRRVETLVDLESALADPAWDAVLTDYNVPGMAFQTIVTRLRSQQPTLPIVLFSGYMGEDQAAELLKAGITDFVLKYRPARLGSAIRRAVADASAQRARRDAEAALQASEERLRLALEGADLGMLRLVFPGAICHLDVLAQRHFELGAEVAFEKLRARVHAEDVERLETVLGQIADPEAAGTFAAEFRVLLSGGATRWLWLTGTAQAIRGGEPSRAIERIGIVQDVTGRTQG